MIQFSVAKVSATCHTFRGGAWLSGKLSCAFEITKPPCGEETATNTKTVTHGAEFQKCTKPKGYQLAGTLRLDSLTLIAQPASPWEFAASVASVASI